MSEVDPTLPLASDQFPMVGYAPTAVSRPPVTLNALAMPVGALCFGCPTLHANNSIAAAIGCIEQSGLPAIPVMSMQGELMGCFSQATATLVLTAKADVTDEIGKYVTPYPTINARKPGREAYEAFSTTNYQFIVVVNDTQQPVGILLPTHLVIAEEFKNRPKTVGGMATPFGVYLTDGSLKGGVGPLALMATGSLMFLLLAGAGLIMDGAQLLLPKAIAENILVIWGLRVAAIAVFALGMRVTGVSGLHAAEHKVVNAIEQGEPLEPETVNRMSRVHPRCGTNLAVGLTMFVTILSTPLIPEIELRTLLAIIFTASTYKLVGSWAQLFVTTSKPRPAQLLSGIKAGRELLSKYESNPHPPAPIYVKLANTGIGYVILGSTLTGGFITLLAWVLNVPPAWRNIIGL